MGKISFFEDFKDESCPMAEEPERGVFVAFPGDHEPELKPSP